MPTLHQHLDNLSAHDLRAMASHLQVSRRKQQKKEAWIDAIAHLWLSPAEERARAAVLARLSGQAQHALCHLAAFDQLPAALFLAEYGAVRRPSRKEKYDPKPWRQPGSVAEEIYYAALLHGVDQPVATQIHTVCIPIDLREAIDQAICSDARATPTTPSTDESRFTSSQTAWALVHDVGQLLILLIEQAQAEERLRLQHGLWLPLQLLDILNLRLCAPDAQPLRSHKQATRLRLLIFLATTAGLQRNGAMTAVGRRWLKQELPDQLRWLWQGWCKADNQLRSQYGQVDALLPPPWPDPLLLALQNAAREERTIISAARLMHALLDGAPQDQAYWSHQMADFSDFQRLLQGVLDAVLTPFGMVDSVTPEHPSSHPPGASRHAPFNSEKTSPRANRYDPHFVITPVGRWLLRVRPESGSRFQPPGPGQIAADISASQPDWAASTRTDAASVAHLSGERWRLALSAHTPLDLQATVAAFAVHIESLRLDGDLTHSFALDGLSVGRAAASGMREPAFFAALARLDIALDDEARTQFMGWQRAIDDVRVSARFLLETHTPELLAKLAGAPDLGRYIHTVLNPTVAVLNAAPATLLSELRAQGIQPRVSWTGDERGGEAATPAAAAGAALWLAGRLYIELARHFPLPLTLPRHHLDELAAGFSATERLLLETEFERMHERLGALLDGATYAPPPETSDPEEWRGLIEEAAAIQRVLNLVYFSAGRNMLTQRHVTPYWVEEGAGGLYMRAYCHLRGDVRLFRLDRIQSLAGG